MYERIKVLEDKIMEIERDFPTWASIHFNQPNKNVNIYIIYYNKLYLFISMKKKMLIFLFLIIIYIYSLVI